MKIGKAIVAGLAGGLAMTVLAWVARQTGLTLNAEMMLGTMTGNAPGMTTWMIGFVMHLMLSALIALLYAVGFERVTHRAGVGVGLAFAVVHIIIGGIVMGMIPGVHPMIPEQMPAPGPFLINMGGAFVAFFVAEHLMFGAIVGALYGPVSSRNAQAASSIA